MLHTGYFDWAATAPLSADASQEYVRIAERYIGNPSSIHREGRIAAQYLEQLRAEIASCMNAEPKSVVFTAGGSESDAIILNSLLRSKAPGQVVIPRFEHAAVTQYVRILEDFGWDVRLIQAPGGFVRPEQIANVLTEKTRLVCCMFVNNVTGTIQDISGIASVIRAHERNIGRKVHFHCDAVQALGKIPVDVLALGIDSAAFSAHKFCGPRGVGILYNSNPAIAALSRGGGQENGLRPGTENLAGIAAMATALRSAVNDLDIHLNHARTIRRYFERRFAEDAPELVLLSPPIDSELLSSSYILSVSVPGIPSEVFTRMLFDQGFCVSSGSACSNNAKQKGEGVLQAMGFDSRLSASSVRISYGYDTTLEDARRLADAIVELFYKHMRK